MKRSQMINSIKELIELNLESLNVVPDATLLSELILDFQEKSGMLPTPHPDISGHAGLDAHEWEQE